MPTSPTQANAYSRAAVVLRDTFIVALSCIDALLIASYMKCIISAENILIPGAYTKRALYGLNPDLRTALFRDQA